MKASILLTVFFVLTASFLTLQVSFANERSCLAANERMTEDMESAASASQAGDMCRAADMTDSALYWAMECEKECAYSRDRLRKAKNMKQQLIYALARLVKLCGH